MKCGAKDWAYAIAARISDEWYGNSTCPEDAKILKEVLLAALLAAPDQCMKLVGTTIIEESYFEHLD
jgi:hypothetical protein